MDTQKHLLCCVFSIILTDPLTACQVDPITLTDRGGGPKLEMLMDWWVNFSVPISSTSLRNANMAIKLFVHIINYDLTSVWIVELFVGVAVWYGHLASFFCLSLSCLLSNDVTPGTFHTIQPKGVYLFETLTEWNNPLLGLGGSNKKHFDHKVSWQTGWCYGMNPSWYGQLWMRTPYPCCVIL